MIMDERIKEILKKYGSIEKIKVDDIKESEIYLYKVKPEDIIPEDERFKKVNIPIGFLVMYKTSTSEIEIHCFSLTKTESYKDAFEVINKVNNLIKYGKMTVDKDGDISWSIVFEQDGTTEDEIKNYMRACLDGIVYLAKEMKS